MKLFKSAIIVERSVQKLDFQFITINVLLCFKSLPIFILVKITDK